MVGGRALDWPWIVALVLLASVTGETIASASTPPLTYLSSPVTLPFLIVAYGFWAVLFREAWARGRLSWAGAILSGIGYTAFNEGLIARTWFRPALDGFTAFRLGRLAGVNWCIVIGLCIFHTVYSMAIPILAIQLYRGEQQRRPWLRRRGIIVVSACVALLTVLTVTGSEAARHSPGRLTAAAVAVVLPLLAVSLPALRPRNWGQPPASPPAGPPRSARPRRPRTAFGVGLCWALAFYLSYYGVPALIGFAAIAAEAAVAALAVRYLANRSGVPWWTPAHWVALIAGSLAPALLFDAFEYWSLETLAVALAIVALIALNRRVRPAPA